MQATGGDTGLAAETGGSRDGGVPEVLRGGAAGEDRWQHPDVPDVPGNPEANRIKALLRQQREKMRMWEKRTMPGAWMREFEVFVSLFATYCEVTEPKKSGKSHKE